MKFSKVTWKTAHHHHRRRRCRHHDHDHHHHHHYHSTSPTPPPASCLIHFIHFSHPLPYDPTPPSHFLFLFT
jgi:hypothetical protein